MSKGPRHLGNTILQVLAAEPGARMPMRELSSRFPLHLKDKTFYRSLRSLEKGGYVYVEGGGRSKIVGLVERPEYAEEMKLAREALAMVATLAKVWNVPVPKPGEKIPDRPPVR